MSQLLFAMMCLAQIVVSPLVEIGVTSASTQIERLPRRTGSITGRVTADGQPMAGAGVFVRKATSNSGVGRTVGTDEDGRFQVDDLLPGAYSVGATSPGYVVSADSAPARYHRVGDVVTIRMTKGGVVTGTVTTSTGEPVIAARVFAILVRDSNGRSIRSQGGQSASTDDRGVYRIYGLQTGSYLVSVNGGQFYSPSNAYAGDVPAYHPSGTRDAAAEVPVLAGQEVTGVDIRYRGERGHAISGTLAGVTESDTNSGGGISVSLIDQGSGAIQSSSFISARESTRTFAMYGIPDGEYHLLAQFTMAGEGSAGSTPRRVVVKGADVTGIQLALAPLGSIAGRLTLETLPEDERKSDCKELRALSLEEAMVLVRRDQQTDKDRSGVLFSGSDGSLNEKGEFVVHRLAAGRYHVGADLPEEWFIRRVTSAGASAAKPPIDVSREGLSITGGQRVVGLSIDVSEGAAGLRGKVSPASGSTNSATRRRVHLVPAEPEATDNALRFYEALVGIDGAFSLSNLAPGRYFALVRDIGDDEWTDRTPRRAAWDTTTRASLRREAQAANIPIELQRCQRVADFGMKYSSPASSRKPGLKNRQ